MKRSQLCAVIVLIGMVVFGWMAALTGFGDSAVAESKEQLSAARDYFERGLFWKSGLEYQDALEAVGKEEDWTKMLQAFASSYEQGENCYNEYLDAAKSAVNAYGKNQDFVMQLVSLYTDKKDFTSAANVLKAAIENGLQNDEVDNALLEVQYASEMIWGAYDEMMPCINGYYRVRQGEEWFYLRVDGDAERHKTATAIGPMGEDEIRTVIYEDTLYLKNDDGVPLGVIRGGVENVGVYADDLIPVQVDGIYAYYDLIGDKQFGSYTSAGTFSRGKAAVQTGESWMLIDSKGKQACDVTFEDIVLNNDGTWICRQVMAAKKDGKYHLYDEEGKQIGTFGCDEIDVVCKDGLIAFRDGNRWGFVNTKGEIVIEPSYECARSFSQGLAAVYNGTAWGFINQDGTVVMEYQFKDADYFTAEGTCMTLTEAGWQLLERQVKD